MLNNSFYLSHVKIFSLVYFETDAEDQFGYGKLSVFCHITASILTFKF